MEWSQRRTLCHRVTQSAVWHHVIYAVMSVRLGGPFASAAGLPLCAETGRGAVVAGTALCAPCKSAACGIESRVWCGRMAWRKRHGHVCVRRPAHALSTNGVLRRPRRRQRRSVQHRGCQRRRHQRWAGRCAQMLRPKSEAASATCQPSEPWRPWTGTSSASSTPGQQQSAGYSTAGRTGHQSA